MELVQSRIITDDVEGMAAFYARLMEVAVTTNEYYVEVPSGELSVGFSKRRFTEHEEAPHEQCRGDVILDFLVDDVDAAFRRIDALGVEWAMLPKTQPWGNRAMMFRDPEGRLVNVFSRQDRGPERAEAEG